jgi:hypothetical protein
MDQVTTASQVSHCGLCKAFEGRDWRAARRHGRGRLGRPRRPQRDAQVPHGWADSPYRGSHAGQQCATMLWRQASQAGSFSLLHVAPCRLFPFFFNLSPSFYLGSRSEGPPRGKVTTGNCFPEVASAAELQCVRVSGSYGRRDGVRCRGPRYKSLLVALTLPPEHSRVADAPVRGCPRERGGNGIGTTRPDLTSLFAPGLGVTAATWHSQGANDSSDGGCTRSHDGVPRR